MGRKSITERQAIYEKLLTEVEKPGRYCGGEFNSIIKNWDETPVRIALAFPDIYEIGLSHLGFRLLYHLINEHHNYLAERVYAPAQDMEDKLTKAGVPLFSLETRRPLADFDLVGFTLQYELSFTNIISMLKLANIPVNRVERGEDAPLIIGGGPGSFNPEPVGDFFDLFLLGEGEEAVPEILALYADAKAHGRRKDWLKQALLKIPGVYLPEFYDVDYEPDGRVKKITPQPGAPTVVKKRVISDFNQGFIPDTEIVPYIEPVHDRLMLEILRGCSRGCRFCQAGMIYRPVRERKKELLEESLARIIKNTGYEEVSLTSLSSTDHTQIQGMIGALTDCYSPQGVNISLPSMRIDAFSPELVERFQGGRKASLTFAPEAGTERLRRVINKNLTHTEIIDSTRAAFEAGWQKLKLYFMIGLPTETDQDLEGIVNLAQEVFRIGKSVHKKRSGQVRVTVSVSTFVPKAHTPFQWRPQITLEETLRKQGYLRDGLKGRGKGLQFSWHEAKSSQLEGVFARGDRRLGKVLLEASALGCKFDSWDDYFVWDKWLKAFEICGINPEFYNIRSRPYDEVLPWSHLSPGVDSKFLEAENRRAEEALTTEDCRTGECPRCGVCPNLKVTPKKAGGGVNI